MLCRSLAVNIADRQSSSLQAGQLQHHVVHMKWTLPGWNLTWFLNLRLKICLSLWLEIVKFSAFHHLFATVLHF